MRSARLGQNFLTNKNVAEKIVRTFLPVKGCILEIGPGKGILTDLLVKHCKGERIYAVELDEELFYKIELKFRGRVEIINRSILDVRLEDVFPAGLFNLLGNLPYYLSREIIDWVISQERRIAGGVFMMQREFVDKILLKEPGARGLMFNFLFSVEKQFDVSPGSFSPPPRVKSTVFFFKKKERPGPDVDVVSFYRFLKRCFINRRKTLLNNLSPPYPEERLWDIFDVLAINPRIRAEQLQPKDFLEIFLRLYAPPS